MTKCGALIIVLSLLSSMLSSKAQVDFSCGQRNIFGLDGTDLDFNDGVSRKGEWPSVCMIIEVSEGGIYEYRHPATLAGKNVLISGGHRGQVIKTNDFSKYRVRCGAWSIGPNIEESDYQESEIEEVYVHPSFNEDNRKYDVSIIIIKIPFDFTSNILPICLPSSDQHISEFSECYAMGWGKKKIVSTKYADNMKSLKISLVEHDKCQEILRSSKLSKYFELNKVFICGQTSGDIRICTGDGGGPVVCKHPDTDRYIQVGVISWGIDCGDNYPDVYNYLPDSMCWIADALQRHNERNSIEAKLEGQEFFSIIDCKK